jgi:hypothetical protein
VVVGSIVRVGAAVVGCTGGDGTLVGAFVGDFVGARLVGVLVGVFVVGA